MHKTTLFVLFRLFYLDNINE